LRYSIRTATRFPAWCPRKGKDGNIELYSAMGLSITYDHRAVDGAPASRFMQELCRNLEQFTTILAN